MLYYYFLIVNSYLRYCLLANNLGLNSVCFTLKQRLIAMKQAHFCSVPVYVTVIYAAGLEFR